jgi:hypothetical protein
LGIKVEADKDIIDAEVVTDSEKDPEKEWTKF